MNNPPPLYAIYYKFNECSDWSPLFDTSADSLEEAKKIIEEEIQTDIEHRDSCEYVIYKLYDQNCTDSDLNLDKERIITV